jgi:outer membrane protein assembly factor BamB
MPGTTYYFAVRTGDKAGNLSAISNSTGALPLSESLYINEVCGSAASGSDWIELFNNTPSPYPLEGCTLSYIAGTIDSPGSETVIWTGAAAATIPTGNIFLIDTLTLDGTAGHFLRLKDALGRMIDMVQWPSHAAGTSFARIYDGCPDYFEIDPGPTKGYANRLSTAPIRINEIDYASAAEFVELYNTSFDTITLSGWKLRNSSGGCFTFTRTLYPQSFSGIDSSSVDDTGKSWYEIFGANGLAAAADSVSVENGAGQIIDRVTWRTGNETAYFNCKAQPVAFAPSAPGSLAEPRTLCRIVSDGTDTGNNMADFGSSLQPTYGCRNVNPTPASENILTYPVSASRLPRRFKLALTLRSDVSAGTNDTLWFIRTGGAPDAGSPHIYRLKDLGIRLDDLSAQTTVMTGINCNDIDGHALSDGTVYRLLLNADNSTAAAPQIPLTNVLYDALLHNIRVDNLLSPFTNDDAKTGIFRITMTNNEPAGGNSVELRELAVTFSDQDNVTLSPLQIQALFSHLYLVADNLSNGTPDSYQSDIDTAALSELSGAALAQVNGRLVLAIADPDNALCRVAPQETKTWFIGARCTNDAHTAQPSTFKCSITPGADAVWRDADTDVEQPAMPQQEFVTSTATVLQPLPPPAGTVYPAPVAPPGTEITGNITLNLEGDTAFAGTSDGTVSAVASDGTPRWSFDAGSPLKTVYDASMDEPAPYLYLATESGLLYKIEDKDSSAAAAPGWDSPRDLGAPITSDLVTAGDYLYVGTGNGEIYKLNRDGTDATDWDPHTGIGAAITGSPAIDNYSPSVNAVWLVGGGGVYRLRNTNAEVTASSSVASAIHNSPFLIAGFADPQRNTHEIYFGDDDGYLRCMNSVNLSTKPVNWNDVYVSSPVRSSPISDYINPENRCIYFGSDNGCFYKVDASSGGIYWTFRTGGPIRTMAVLGDNNDIYFGSDDGCFYGLNKNTGQLLTDVGPQHLSFPLVTGAEVRGSPCYDFGYDGHHPGQNYIYFGSNDGKMYCIDVTQ